jgi:DNA-binding transcriptional LysR family regulator
MFDWEDLRHFLAVARVGTLSGAARALRVDHATVSRRLAALENDLQVRLVDRLPRTCHLTTTGQRIFELAQKMEERAYAIDRAVRASQSPLVGKVTLSVPPVLVVNFVAKHLADFRLQHPDIQLSVLGQAQHVSLSRREADLAVRLTRPKEPSSIVRKLGSMPFALYANCEYLHLQHPATWEFIVFDAQFDDMPQQKWLRGIAGARPIACEISDINGHLAAAREGVGVAGLPCFLGDADTSLQRLTYEGPSFTRDIWLIVHRDLRRSATIRAVMDFLVAVVGSSGTFEAKRA